MIDRLLDDAAQRAIRFLHTLEKRNVAPTPEALKNLSGLGGPTPDEPCSPEETLALLDASGSPADRKSVV